MSLHKKIRRINAYLEQSEPSYEGYMDYIYYNDGTMKRFCTCCSDIISYEVGTGIPYGSFVESECSVEINRRLKFFVWRKYHANI